MNDIEHAIVKNAFKALISSILDVTEKIDDPFEKATKIMEIASGLK